MWHTPEGIVGYALLASVRFGFNQYIRGSGVSSADLRYTYDSLERDGFRLY